MEHDFIFILVPAPVGVETGAGAEPLVALWADVRLLPGVCPDVSLEQAGPVKRLAAHRAGQHCLLLGSPVVLQKVASELHLKVRNHGEGPY